MRSIAVYLVQLAYGGPEEGGWYYQTGELCTDPELTAFGTTFTDGHEARAKAMADEVQVHLDRDWNTGDHARDQQRPLRRSLRGLRPRWLAPCHLPGRASPLRMTRTTRVYHFLSERQESVP